MHGVTTDNLNSKIETIQTLYFFIIISFMCLFVWIYAEYLFIWYVF